MKTNSHLATLFDITLNTQRMDDTTVNAGFPTWAGYAGFPTGIPFAYGLDFW